MSRRLRFRLKELPTFKPPEVEEELQRIAFLLGRYRGMGEPEPQEELRFECTLRQVSALQALKGEPCGPAVVAHILTTQEANPTIESAIRLITDDIRAIDPSSVAHLQEVHRIVFQDREEAGHITSPIDDLISTLQNTPWDNRERILRTAAQFLIQLERTIKPFASGNGLMARIWCQAALGRHFDVMNDVPLISGLSALQLERITETDGGEAGLEAQILQTIRTELEWYLEKLVPERECAETRLMRAKRAIGRARHPTFSRKEYRRIFKGLSTATATRDLGWGVSNGILMRHGDRRKAVYTFEGIKNTPSSS